MNQLLAKALNTWPQWQVEQPSAPIYLRELTSGLTNKSHLVRMGVCDYVIRLNEQGHCASAINRVHEQCIVETLSSHKLCPKVVFPNIYTVTCDQEVTVFEYMDGRAWDNHDFADKSNQQRLLRTMETYRQLMLDIPKFDYLGCVRSYWEAIGQRGITMNTDVVAAFAIFCQRVDLFLKPSYTPVLSHHDLVPDNIIETQQGLVILDWEYAGMGHPDFDSVYIKKYMAGLVETHPPMANILHTGNKPPIEQLIDWLNYLWLVLR